MKDDTPSFLKNCYLKPRDDQEGPMFVNDGDGTIIASLDGYAVVPCEEYEALVNE